MERLEVLQCINSPFATRLVVRLQNLSILSRRLLLDIFVRILFDLVAQSGAGSIHIEGIEGRLQFPGEDRTVKALRKWDVLHESLERFGIFGDALQVRSVNLA